MDTKDWIFAILYIALLVASFVLMVIYFSDAANYKAVNNLGMADFYTSMATSFLVGFIILLFMGAVHVFYGRGSSSMRMY